MQAEQKLIAETVEKPRVPFVTPNTLVSNLPPASMRQTPTLPYQPDDRGIPFSPSAKMPLPASPDVRLSIDFCQEKLKKKFELCGNDPKRLCVNNNFAFCMHTLATFYRSFDPIELGNDEGYLYPCHGQHPENEKLWKETDCETYCFRKIRAGVLGYCAPCDKKRKSFLQKAKRKKERLAWKEGQLELEGVQQECSSRPYSTMSPETAKHLLRANAVERKSTKKKISYLKNKLKADKETMKITASDSSIRELVVNVSGIILDGKWNAKEAIIDALLEVEGKADLDKSIKRFKSNTTGRGAKSENGIAFRLEIQALAKRDRGSTKGKVLKSKGGQK
jgi:hypothetical protein